MVAYRGLNRVHVHLLGGRVALMTFVSFDFARKWHPELIYLSEFTYKMGYVTATCCACAGPVGFGFGVEGALRLEEAAEEVN